MTLPLFTMICEFKGGTYVSQVRAADELAALVQWAALLERDRPMGAASRKIARQAASGHETAEALDGLSGVWCWTALVGEALVLTNIVRSA